MGQYLWSVDGGNEHSSELSICCEHQSTHQGYEKGIPIPSHVFLFIKFLMFLISWQ